LQAQLLETPVAVTMLVAEAGGCMPMTASISQTPDSTERLNHWVAEQTHGRIPTVIDRLDPDAMAVLLNALYFKGQWSQKFDPALTQPRDFSLNGGSHAKVERMKQSGHFDYFRTLELQAIRLPFGSGALVMHVFLPTSSSSLEGVEAQLTPEQWRHWRARYVRREGVIELPRFELETGYELKDALKALGLNRAFRSGGSQAAELDAMLAAAAGRTGTEHFFLSSVRQSLYWKLDEEGSEAAAATSTQVHVTSVTLRRPPFQMIVDRPFLCAIEDTRSGALLFIGAIFDPTAASREQRGPT
jgi:serpin B